MQNLVCNKDGILIKEENGGLLYKLLGKLDKYLKKKVITIPNTLNQSECQIYQSFKSIKKEKKL